MPEPKLTVIPDILEEHLEELAFLWRQRIVGLHSTVHTPAAFRRLEDRIEAHVQGLLVGGDQAIPIIKDGLVSEIAAESFAAAYALLRLQLPAAAGLVMEAFAQAQEGQLEGIQQALCHGPLDLVLAEVRRISAAAGSPVAAAATEALQFHSSWPSDAGRLEAFLLAEPPRARQIAWRILGQAGLPKDQNRFELAVADKDPGVRREALWAAGWTQPNWLLSHCRSLAVNPTKDDWEGLMLLAILGRNEDLPVLLGLARRLELGSQRFQLLRAFGHPGVVEDLLREMAGSDLRSVVAAGVAFTQITGCAVESSQRVQLPPEDGHPPDEFEKEFLEDAKLPDVPRARTHWQTVKGQLTKGTRWARGVDLSHGARPEILEQLDLVSRRETCLRGRFDGTWKGNPLDLERFPLMHS